MAKEVIKDALKKDARRLEQAADMSGLAAPAAAEADADSRPARRLGELDEILLGLPAVDHRIITAYAHAGGDGPWAADLAGELGLRAGTIRVRCRRIKERIRREMASHSAPAGADAVATAF